ncbi:MAG: hypothetical protein WA082_04465 [Candidatus Moraniibacteriota bacterium]
MNITYNGLNLNDTINYWVEDLPHEDVAKPEINLQKIARTNRSILLKKGYGIKTIKVTVIVEDSTVAAMDSRMDDFKETIESSEKNLDVEYAGGTRRYVATGYIENIDRRTRWARVQLRLECYRAFGEDTAETTESFAAKTTSPYTDDIEIAGNAPATPDITITINSFTGAADRFMQIKNTVTGEYIKVTKNDWVASDIIQIYTAQAIVTVNGNITQYLGIMPVWNPGDNDWEYTDDFTARNVDIDFAYKKKWL